MMAGEIIKYYRIKAGLTQEQLGKGICTSNHICRIERGQTTYSSEIIILLSERLQIDIEKEVNRFENMENQLHRWHKSIILQRMNEVEQSFKDLEGIPFINSSKHAALYKLLQARYYILQKDFKKVITILKYVQKEFPVLPPYEKNLLLHVWGIYFIMKYNNFSNENHQKAVQVLKEVDLTVYDNQEYFYSLAVAYFWNDSNLMAYDYAKKALQHFKETNNFLRVIDALGLILVLRGNDPQSNFQEIVDSYHNLIHDCEILNATDRIKRQLSDLAYQYFQRKDYANAQKFSLEALKMTDKSSSSYLYYLHNYLKSSLNGNLLPKTELLKLANNGMSLAKEMNNSLQKILLKLLIYQIENKLNQYFKFIEKDALPYFQSKSHKVMIKRYTKELFDYLMENEQYEKAARISKVFMDTVS